MISAVDVLRGRALRLGLLAALIAIPLSTGVFWAWESLTSAPPGRRDGATFQPVSGRGEATPIGFRISAGEDAGQVMVATTLPGISAGAYGSLVFDIEGLDASRGSGIYFMRRQDPTVGHPRALTLALVRQGHVNMAEDPRWIGQIDVIGFIVQGPIRRDIVIRSVTVLPRSTGFWDVVARLGRSWAALSDWDAGSANFYIGASARERLVTPAAFSGLWALWSWIVYLLLNRYTPRRSRINGSNALSMLVGLLAVGWGALDLRWQLDLVSRFNSIDSMAQTDRETSRRWVELRKRFFNNKQRVFIVSTEPDSFQVLRLRYDLAGINSSVGLDRLPNITERRAGDFVILLGDRRVVRLDRSAGEVWFGGEAVNAEVMLDDPLIGTLIRVIA